MRLKNNMLEEVELLKDKLFYLSISKEQKQQRYLNSVISMNQNLHNQLTGQAYNMSYNLKQKQMKNVRERQQQIYAICSLSESRDLQALFITLTVSSEFHPWNSKKNHKNINFSFADVDSAIVPAYRKLKKVYTRFYTYIKRYITKDLLYIKVYEPHQSLIPHMHCMFFVESQYLEKVKIAFEKIVKDEKLERVDLQESQYQDEVRDPVAYIMKYLFKTTIAEDDYMARWLDRWRRKYKIRVLETTQLPMSLEIYRHIYYSIDEELKKEIDEEIQEKNMNYFEYLMKNTHIEIETIDEIGNTISKKIIEQGVKK